VAEKKPYTTVLVRTHMHQGLVQTCGFLNVTTVSDGKGLSQPADNGRSVKKRVDNSINVI
jgi:hypothetical protein